MTGYAAAATWYLEAGWSPLPLPHGQKTPPPNGTTGAEGRRVSYADVADWSASMPESNIALRLPENVVGIDIDAYKADAVATMQELTARLGPLPPTWRSTSRGRMTHSGIYLYRIPDDLHLRIGDVGPGVETIRSSHRYAVVAPSLHPEGGTYEWLRDYEIVAPPKVVDLPNLPDAWVGHLMAQGEARKIHREDVLHDAYDALDPAEKQRIDGYLEKTLYGIKGDLRASASWKIGETDGKGRGWEKLQADKALRLAALAAADWNPYSSAQAAHDFVEWSPTGGDWTIEDVKAKYVAQMRRADPAPFPPAPPARVGLDEMWAGPPSGGPQSVSSAAPGAVVVQGYKEKLVVNNPGQMVGWLNENVGVGPLSGIFARGQDLVFTPQIGHQGYVEPRAGQAEGSASITVLNHIGLLARITNRYDCITLTEQKGKADEPSTWKESQAIFPADAARVATAAVDDLPFVRQLHTVIHTPSFRPDGTLIDQPGYDDATQTLFLPTGGQPPAIPSVPSGEDLRIARGWIDYMLQDFRFVTADDRANYIGLMLSPMLRALVPPPYKLGVIEAHQPGSGKTFLARALITLHGGIMHSELPGEEPEIVKTITSVLDTSTGAVVVFDNVTGMVRSSALAGMLTSATFQGRRLGTGTMVEAVNDRLWVITGNNAALGGDLVRRSLRVRIDPGVPDPEQRTDFVISDFEEWVKAHRGDLLWSLLVLARHWIVSGSPVPTAVRQDSYGKWGAVIGSVLGCAGMPGTFDEPGLIESTKDLDESEWGAFFATAYEVLGTSEWTTKSLLSMVQDPGGLEATKPIAYESLPGGLLESRSYTAPSMLGRAFGKWLANREGRWFDGLTVRRAGISHKTQVWRFEKYARP